VLPSFEDPELIGLLEENGVTIKAKSEEKSWVWTLLVSFLPWLLLIGFFVYTSKKFQERVGGRLFGFGKSKAKVFTKATIDITYEEVAGLSNMKKELQEVVFSKGSIKIYGTGRAVT
jgi:cell division protease FtsH